MIITRYLPIRAEGNTVLINITSDCRKFVSETNLKNGIITVFNPGSTASLTTIEYDPNLIKDFKPEFCIRTWMKNAKAFELKDLEKIEAYLI